MQGRNGDADRANGLLDTVREEKSGTKEEGSINTPPCVKEMAGETVWDYAGSPAWCSVMTT